MKKSRSRRSDRLGALGAIAFTAVLAAGAASAQALVRLEPVFVQFTINDWHYHECHLTQADLDEVAAAASTQISKALQDRIGHLDFQTAQGADAKLVCSMDADTQGAREQRDGVRWYFTLTSSKLTQPVTGAFEYLSWVDSARPIPRKNGLKDEILAFIDGAPATDPSRRGAVDRWAPIYSKVLAQLPLFTGQTISHIATTPLLAVNARRSDYADTLPDSSEFLLSMTVKLPGGALEPKYDFRARILDEAHVRQWDPQLQPAGLSLGVVAEVYSCEPIRGCPATTIQDLRSSPKCTIVSALKLVTLIPPKTRAAPPDVFNPARPSQ